MKLRFAPVTTAFVAMMWIAFGSANPRERIGYNLPADEDLWHLLTAGLTAGHLSSLAYLTLAAVCFCVPAERALGSRWFALTAVCAQAVTMPVACVAGAAVERAGFNLWGPDLVNEVYCTPVAWIFGPLAFATARFGVLWRRRLRMVMVALTATLVLYAGSLSSVAALTAVLLGWAAGELTQPSQRIRRASLRESRVLVATVFAAVAAGPVVTAINPLAQGPFAATSRLMWEPSVSAREVARACTDAASDACAEAVAINQQNGLGPFLLNAAPFALAALVTFGLVRGRRLSWWLAVAMSVASATAVAWQAWQSARTMDVGYEWVWNTVLVALPFAVVFVVLIATRERFRVASAWQRAAVPFGAVFAATALAWLGGVHLLRDDFLAPATLATALAELPCRYLPPSLAVALPHHLIPRSDAAWALYEWVGIVFWTVTLYLLYRVLTSAPSPANARQRERAREILASGTGDHLAWMGLWEGNSYFFYTPDDGVDRGFVAYRVANGVAVTVGGPVWRGSCSSDTVALAFEAFAAEQGWRVAWYSVSEDFARDGFQRIHVAEESVLTAENADFKGKKFQNIRTARNRAGKEGVTAVWSSWAECDLEMREKIVALSESWVADKALPEMGFTLGGVDELRDKDTKLLLAVDKAGRLHGVTSWLPVYEQGLLAGYTLDFMRRDADGFRPVIEFLLAEAVAIAAEQGLGWVSLSGAPLARSDEPTSLIEILLDKAGATLEPLYGFRSLAASKYKFHPVHHSWHLLYDDELALPSIALAVVHCYLPDMKPADAAAAVTEILARRSAASPAQPASGTTDHP